MYNVGKPTLAPMPMTSNVTRRVTFGPTTAATNTVTTGTTAAPTAATTTPTATTTTVPVTTTLTEPTLTYVTSRALEFDKGGRQSSSDYGKPQNHKQWSKWHHALMGNANEYKCEQVLDPSYTPNPDNPNKIALFGLQQQFMYSVFAKTLVEGKAADILREYLDPQDRTKFGDAQKIYANLCNFYKGGAMTRVSAATLESRLANMWLNKMWTKTVSTFATTVSHLIRDHKEATQGIHTDDCYIEKLNATFFEHKDMAAHIQTMEMQDAMLL